MAQLPRKNRVLASMCSQSRNEHAKDSKVGAITQLRS
jgi:hypothetical protein